MDRPFIVMLDLDGPICTTRAFVGRGDHFDPVAAGMLARLCEETGARIVIVSARRLDEDLPAKLAELGLARHLFDHPEHWRTGHDPKGIRGNEVDAWHADNPGHERYAIVDDERGGYAPHHIRVLVHTGMWTGLQLKDMRRLRRLMGMPVSDRDIEHADAEYPRITLAQHARDALAALEQGDEDRVRALLAIIEDHPLAQ